LSTSVKASDQNYGRLYEAGNRAARALAMEPPAIYVAPSTFSIDARALGTDDDACVVFGEEIAAKLTNDELVAMVGHELAHIQNNHIPYTTALYYLQHDAVFFVRWAVQPAIIALQAWARRADVTCDRAALLVTRDLDVTLSAVIKTASRGAIDPAEYLANLPDKQAGVTKYAEMFRSHPALPKRVQALRLFAQSTFYKLAVGQDVIDGLSSDAVDQRVGEILSVF
jgi:Zn-dependent protease with chaperone function